MTSRAIHIIGASVLAAVVTMLSAAAALASPATTTATTTSSTSSSQQSTATTVSAPAAIGARVMTAPSKIAVTRTAKDAVRITWPKRAGATSYVVIASGRTGELASTTTRGTGATIAALKPTTRYTFIVTPMRGAAALKPMRAAMTHPLAGAPAVVLATQTPDKTPATNSEESSAEPTPTESKPTVSPTPPTSPSPSMPTTPAPPRFVTIWECPLGFAEQSDGSCTQTRPHTFYDVTTTQAYTYHGVWVQTGTEWVPVQRQWNGECVSPGRDYDGNCGWIRILGHTRQDKDATPTGFVDNGTEWTRTDTVRDDAPEGFVDDGSQWVRMVSKMSRQVAV